MQRSEKYIASARSCPYQNSGTRTTYLRLAYIVFMTSRKFAHYFAEHPITMVSSVGLSDILTNPDAIGRVAKWVIELGPHDLKYEHPNAIKAQVLPDFTTEWKEAQLPIVPDVSNSWTI